MQSYDRISLWGLYQYDETILDTLVLPETFTADEKQTIKDNILIETAELELYWTDPNFLKIAINKWSKKRLPVWDRIKYTLELDYNPIENYDRYEEWSDTHEGSKSGTTTKQGRQVATGSRQTTDTLEETGEQNDSGTETRNVESSATGSGTTSSTASTTSESDNTTSGTETETNSNTNRVMGFDVNELMVDHDANNGQTQKVSSATTHGEGESSTTTSGTSGSTDSSETDETVSRTGASETSKNAERTTEDTTENTTTDDSTIRDSGTEESSGEHEGHLHGNIGVTTAVQMWTEEVTGRMKYNIMDIIINDFIAKFCLRVY